MTTRSLIRAFTLAASMLVAAPSFAAESIGVVGSLQGTATAGTATTAARALKVGDQIFLDEEVTTDAGSKLQLMLNDRSTITLNPNSKVKVREFAYNPNSDSGSMAMESVKGAFRFIGGALSKQNPVTIKTPVSSIGIRGGIADTSVAPNGATDAVFLYGDAMTMTNSNGQTMEITTPGQGLSMQTPSDVPTFTPPNVVQQIIGTFGQAPAGDNAGASNGTTSPTTDTANQSSTGASESSDASGSTDSMATATNEMKKSDTANAMTGSMAKMDSMSTTMGNMTSAASTTKQTQANHDKSGTITTGGIVPIANPTYKGFYGMPYLPSGETVFERGTVVGSAAATGKIRFVATETNPSPNALSQGYLPEISNLGYNSIPDFQLDAVNTQLFSGFGYVTSSRRNFYYHVEDSATGIQRLNIFFGQNPTGSLDVVAADTVTQTAFEGTGAISFFNFTPDLIAYDADGAIGSPLGFFNYGMLDISQSAVVNDGGRPANFGMAVDFSNGRFFSGFLKWSTPSVGVTTRDLVVSFGDLDNTSSTLTMAGTAFDFSQNGSLAPSLDIRAGNINTNQNGVYTDGGNVVEAIVLTGNVPTGLSGLGTERLVTPMIRRDGGSLGTTPNLARTPQNMKGFAAGFVVDHINGGSMVRTVRSDALSDVSVTTNADGSVDAAVTVQENGTPANTISAQFDSTQGSSAFLSNNMYAVQQTGATYAGRNPGTYSSNNGFLVNATEIAQVSGTPCTACEFVHWGVWAGEVNRGSVDTPIIDTAYAIPYVAGTVTQNASSQAGLGNVTYTGPAYGSEYNSATQTLQRTEGSFTAGIDMANRTINTFNLNVGSLSHNATPNVLINGTGPAVFGFDTTAGNITGHIGGSLYGGAAENIGGNYVLTDTTTNVTGAGVYLGAR